MKVCSNRADPRHDVVSGVHTGPRGVGRGRTFEVASVKPNHLRDARLSFGGPPGRYEIVNAPLRTIVRVAHQVQDYQIVEAPGWIAN